jgi:hypothetical protein
MSRSNPSENSNPNPATRWFEWSGEHGVVRYYDKEAKKNVDVGSDFTFILLDQLGTVRGWHDASQSGIYSNEVKDTRQDAMVVKAFKGGTLIEGIYRDIKDRVNALGGRFNANCYIAFKNGGNQLALGAIRFKGSALGAWMDFTKEHRDDLYKKSIRIHGYDEGKKGRIVFRTPKFTTKDISPETDAAAIVLDRQLQEFLASYLKRPKREQVEEHDDLQNDFDEEHESLADPRTDDDIPF